jgi:hypothetical protein
MEGVLEMEIHFATIMAKIRVRQKYTRDVKFWGNFGQRSGYCP